MSTESGVGHFGGYIKCVTCFALENVYGVQTGEMLEYLYVGEFTPFIT